MSTRKLAVDARTAVSTTCVARVVDWPKSAVAAAGKGGVVESGI